MLSRFHFPPRRARWLAAAVVVAAIAIGAPAVGRAQSPPLMEGPHPFARDNEVSAHVLLGTGVGDSPSGAKLAVDYGYHLGGATWLNLEANGQFGGCGSGPGPCGNGPVFETMAGGKWKFATSVPVVVHAKAAGGLVYVFPDDGRAALGVALRGGGGATYFFYDWIGVGLEACFSLGHVSYESTYNHDATYAVVDFGGGIEVQF
ncbi:MAG TPA: hypothetical protein VMU50_08250 [Polyangia bacterium]|nr:hypothetical protein [Polyangia bacterium]